jgi:hypothetical protein
VVQASNVDRGDKASVKQYIKNPALALVGKKLRQQQHQRLWAATAKAFKGFDAVALRVIKANIRPPTRQAALRVGSRSIWATNQAQQGWLGPFLAAGHAGAFGDVLGWGFLHGCYQWFLKTASAVHRRRAVVHAGW